MSISVLRAGVDYEGSSIVLAYVDDYAAKEACRELMAWLLLAPRYSGEEDLTAHLAAEDKWKETCPLAEAKEFGYCDYFDVVSVELKESP